MQWTDTPLMCCWLCLTQEGSVWGEEKEERESKREGESEKEGKEGVTRDSGTKENTKRERQKQERQTRI